MKRLGMVVLALAVLVVATAPALAQAPQQNFTVTFGGQMRVYGIVWDNFTDFADTGKRNPVEKLFGIVPPPTTQNLNKDSESYYFQRWRLYTTVESADKNAKVVWAIEVGDITWGLGGGSNGNNFNGGVTARTGNSTGGQVGNDGVNVETKNLYLQFNIPWVPNSNILLGIHNIVWLNSPAGAFMDDDGAGIQLNFKWDPVDLQLYTVKAVEGTRASADDADMYAARVGFNLNPDTRFTLEGLVFGEQCAGNRAAPDGRCVSADFADSYWIGGTVGTKVAGITLHGSFVYGNRKLFSAPTAFANGVPRAQGLVDEEGWGAQIVAQVPIGPVSTWWQAWYTSGDQNRIVGGGCADVTVHPQCGPFPTGSTPQTGIKLPAGTEMSTVSPSQNLVKKSDKLPIPDYGASWGNVPFVGEFVRGLFTIGAPGFGSTMYADPTGTWGIGGSATFALTPAFSIGGGIAYIAASEDQTSSGCAPGVLRCGGGVFGDWVTEFDGGVIWRYNPNLTITGLLGYAIPDIGQEAWGATFRTQFSF